MPHPPLEAGTEIAPGYAVIEHLRRGNDLDVYDAWSHERRARVAIKMLRGDRAHKVGARQALITEGELLERFTHPHIVRAYETLRRPLPAVVMETLSGATLSALIEEEPAPDAEGVAHLGLQIASALDYLHSHRLVHLDLKPSNLIGEAGRVKLIDLSLAQAPGPVRAGRGSYHYLSPEQARGDAVDTAADVWGIGAVLFEVATGEAPYDDDPDAFTEVESASGTYSEAAPDRYPQLERAPRRPEDVGRIDPELASVIADCLHLQPAKRPSLDGLMARLEVIAHVPDSERFWSRSR